MELVTSIPILQKKILKAKGQGLRISFVPTMGALHEGHLSLIRTARKKGDILVLSIFVNPTQFGPREDYKKYPRTLARDKRLARECGVDIIFYPSAAEMYPPDYSTSVIEERLSKVMCGRTRPGHFRGVTTVVLKLFNIVQPDIAFLGQKDAQQAVIIKKMVENLNLPIEIEVLPIVREKDGLALSSRNKYLSRAERRQALSLYEALRLIAKTRKLSVGKNHLKKYKLVKLDYLVTVDKETLHPLKKIKKDTLIAIAASVGKTRLIDNIII